MAVMQLPDFELLDRGPCLFDRWQHRERVPSPLGDFVIALHVEMDEEPTPAMLAAAEQLVTRFGIDKENLAQSVFDNYLSVCADPDGPEWLRECGVPEGLSLSELSPYLDPRILSINGDLGMCVYTSPDWDREHGLHFYLEDGKWELQ